jgi:putative hydrolase of the HAD superfamily
LITVVRPVGETYAEVARRYGGRLSPDHLAAGFAREFPGMVPLAFPALRGDELARREREWWKELVRRVVAGAGEVSEFDRFFAALYAHYEHGAAWRLFPEVAPVLGALRERGIPLAVVSNFDSRLWGILRELAIDRHFDAIVCSSVAGAAKPDPAIFLTAIEKLGVEAGDVLHVGDDERADVLGARRAGLRALLVDRRGGGTPGAIRTLDDLLALPALA